MRPSEGLAIYDRVEQRPELFLAKSGPARGRGLDPGQNYVACRWDYRQTPISELRASQALVRSTATGAQALAWPADWGPNAATRRAADLSPNLLKLLGLDTDSQVEVTFPAKEGDNVMSWRVAKSLDQLLRQVNALYPNRDKSSDGSIGDEHHAVRTSDHNPYIKDSDGVGVVRARDFTNDPLHGLSSEELAQKLIGSRDERIRYVISNRKIASGPEGPQAWTWRKYTGQNPHDHHCHVSVREQQKFYDDVSPWRFDMQRAPQEIEHIVTPTRPVLRLKAVGNDVKILQALLVRKAKAKIMIDGEFGASTQNAVIAFQRDSKLVADGVVGPYTWKALEATA